MRRNDAGAGGAAGENGACIYSNAPQKTKGQGPRGPAGAQRIASLSSAPGFQSSPLVVVRTAPRNRRSLVSFCESR